VDLDLVLRLGHATLLVVGVGNYYIGSSSDPGKARVSAENLPVFSRLQSGPGWRVWILQSARVRCVATPRASRFQGVDMNDRNHRILAALCAAASLLLPGLAAAATYVGRFDPPVYEGVASFEIPNGCVPAGTGVFLIPVGTVTCPQVDFLSATVVNHPATDPPTGILTFGPVSDVGQQLLWDDGILLGLDTDLIQAAAPNGTFNNPGGYALQFFTGSFAFSFAAFSDVTTQQVSGPFVELLACLDGCFANELVGPEPATQEPYARVVPEPASLALFAGALLAAGFVRRRRR
jgi:hypothetical protein